MHPLVITDSAEDWQIIHRPIIHLREVHIILSYSTKYLV